MITRMYSRTSATIKVAALPSSRKELKKHSNVHHGSLPLSLAGICATLCNNVANTRASVVCNEKCAGAITPKYMRPGPLASRAKKESADLRPDGGKSIDSSRAYRCLI